MSAIKFEAKLEEINGVALVRLPEAASKQLSSRGINMVKGTVNKTPIETILEPDGIKGHWLEVTKTMLAETKVKVGDTLNLELESTTKWIEPKLPKDLEIELKSDKIALQTWGEVTSMARWEWIRWVRSTHNPETRKKRIGVAMSKLSKGNKRPCCFNSATCTIPEVAENSKYGWVLRHS
jgi:hypothetical protein